MELSDAARELLLEASRDTAGLIVRLTAPGGGAYLKTNGRAFGDGSPREQARWESGLRQLMTAGLVEAQGHKVVFMTLEGYQAVDAFRRREQ